MLSPIVPTFPFPSKALPDVHNCKHLSGLAHPKKCSFGRGAQEGSQLGIRANGFDVKLLITVCHTIDLNLLV